MASREPELYIKIDREDMSFEVPEEKIVAFIGMLIRELKVDEIELRYEEDSHAKSLCCGPDELIEKLLEKQDFIKGEPVVFELGEATLYSNGGGCMVLKTGIDSRRKKRLAQHFLELCGFSAEVETTKFTALVRGRKLEVITK